MLAAIPLLLSLASARTVLYPKRDEGSLIERDPSPFEIQSYKRGGFSISADLESKIGVAIDSTIHIPGINDTEVLNVIVSSVDKDLSVLKMGFEQLDPIHIGEVIERAVAKLSSKLGAKFSSIAGKLIESIEASIEGSLGISIAFPAPHL